MKAPGPPSDTGVASDCDCDSDSDCPCHRPHGNNGTDASKFLYAQHQQNDWHVKKGFSIPYSVYNIYKTNTGILICLPVEMAPGTWHLEPELWEHCMHDKL